MEIKKPSDEEVLEIIRKLRNGEFKSQEEDSEMLWYISRHYPEISNLIFRDKRNLTAEQVLEEAKKLSKPILL